MIFVWPEHLPAGRRIQRPARLADLLPTLEGLLGLEVDGRLDGRDLSALLLDTRDYELDWPVFLVAPRYQDGRRGPEAPSAGVRQGAWKLIVDRAGRGELYDLAGDPREQTDVARREPGRTRSLRRLLDRWLANEAKKSEKSTKAREVDPRHREALEALGYVE